MNASAERRINNLFMKALKEERRGRPIQARACRQSAKIVRFLWKEE
ncbi:MAG: hypothetical protein WCK53_13300 [Methanomicrobiales archaeon]